MVRQQLPQRPLIMLLKKQQQSQLGQLPPQVCSSQPRSAQKNERSYCSVRVVGTLKPRSCCRNTSEGCFRLQHSQRVSPVWFSFCSLLLVLRTCQEVMLVFLLLRSYVGVWGVDAFCVPLVVLDSAFGAFAWRTLVPSTCSLVWWSVQPVVELARFCPLSLMRYGSHTVEAYSREDLMRLI